MKKKRWSGSDQAFGLLFTAIFLFLFVKHYWRESHFSISYGVLAIVFLVLSLFIPRSLSPLKFVWMKFGEIAGKIITPIIMGFLFFIPLSGLSLIMRVFNVQYMPLKFNKKGTYWVPRDPKAIQDYSKQF